MKKIFHIIAAAAALAMTASCQKAQITESPMTGVSRFTATILQTKTAIASDGKVTWREGDEIKVTDASANTAVYVAESAGASTAFNIKNGETPLGAGPYSAAYGDISNQVYDADGANCPLTATETASTNFTFKSPYAVLKITANSAVAKLISKVTVENSGEALATLSCGSGVQLPTAGGAVFHIAVPAGTYSGLRIVFEAIVDPITETAAKARSSEVTLAAGDLLPLALNFTEDDWQPACVAAGTMITMANGDRKAVEELVVGDLIRTFDHENGIISSAPVCFVWESKNVAKAFTLTFDGGVEVTVVEEHGFYDQEGRKYAFINAYNAGSYIGHHFYNADNKRWLELKGFSLLNRGVDAYAVATSGHIDHLANGMLSFPDGSFKILSNLFEYDDQLRFDADSMAGDIEKFGLTPLDKILEYKGFTEADYNDYNLRYLNVAIGKGLTSWEYVQALSDYCEENMIY